MPAPKTRTCPLCKKKDIKHLSAHLKNKHKLADVKERAPHLKRSLENKNVNEVKQKDTVCEEDGRGLTEFHEQERILGASFQDIEDRILKLRLSATRDGYSAISEQCFRLEIRAKLLPLYGMVMKSLETLLLSCEPIEQLKQADEAPPAAPKRKKKRDVQYSFSGMDYLENGLVQCQLCKFTWDGNAQHSCPYDDDDEDDEELM